MATEVLASPMAAAATSSSTAGTPRPTATVSTSSSPSLPVEANHLRSSLLQMNHHQASSSSSAMQQRGTSATDGRVGANAAVASSTSASAHSQRGHAPHASTSSSSSQFYSHASTSSGCAAVAAELAPAATFFVQAEYAFASTDPSALSFAEGDVIEVLTRLESGWWDGLLLIAPGAEQEADGSSGSRRGWFPSNYVRVISDEETEAWFFEREEAEAAAQEQVDGAQGDVRAGATLTTMTASSTSPDAQAARDWLAQRIGVNLRIDDSDAGITQSSSGTSTIAAGERAMRDTELGEEEEDGVDGDGGGLGALARELLKAHASDSEGEEDLRQEDLASSSDGGLFFQPTAGAAVNGQGSRTAAIDPADCWVPSMTMDGQIFYRNTLTGEESWEQHPAALDGAELSPVTPSDDRSSIASSRRSILLRRPGDASPFGVPPRTTSIDRLDAVAQGGGFGAYAAARSLPTLKMRDDGSGFVPLPSRGAARNDDALRAFGIAPGSATGSGSSRPISEALSTSSGGRASSLISLERTSMARIESELLRPLVDDASRLKQMLGLVDEEVTAVVDAAESYMTACAMAGTPGGGAPDPDVTDLPEAQALDTAVRALVPAIRTLVTTSRHVIAGLTALIEDDSAVLRAYTTNERIHPAQRRVVAALSKVVFFSHSAVGMAWPPAGAVERLATDAMDLHHAVSVFVDEIRRFGSLSESGLGLKSAQPSFGYERVTRRKREWTRLAIDTLAELKRRANVVRDQLGQASVADVDARLEDVIVYLDDIDVAATLDVDGIFRRDGTVFDQAGPYNELVNVARNGHKRVEVLSAQLTDATAVLLLEMLEGGPLQSEPLLDTLESLETTLLALLDIGAAQVAELVEIGWRGRVGRRSLRIAEREKAARHVRSASRSSSLASPAIKSATEERALESLAEKPSVPGRPSLTRSMTSFDQLNPLSRRQSDTPSRMSASSSMTSLSFADNDVATVSSSRRSSASHLMRHVPFLRNRSGSDVDKRSNTVGGGSRKKLAQMLGEADVQRLMQSPPTMMTPTLTIPERPAYLGVDYAEDELVMNPDGSVKAGSLPALVERLTFHEMMDATFNATFLMTYRSFATPEQVIDLLRARYNLAPPEDLSEDELKDWQDRKQKPVKLRVFNTLKTWVDQHYTGERDGDVLEQIEAFVKTTMMPDAQLQMPAQHLLKAIERRRSSDQGQARRLTSVIGMPPAPHIPKSNLGKGPRLLDINPIELARQLTLYEAQLYQKIRPIECLHKAWSQTDKPESGANIKAMILTSNKIAGWVAGSILEQRDLRKRSSTMKHFVLTAEQCRSLNNFSTMAAIMAGLNSTPIIRLKRTRDSLSSKTIALMDDLDSTLDSGRNFTAYRELLKRVVPPAIPFLGVYLTYLTVLEENSDWLPHPTDPDRKLINFFKRQRSAEIIREIQQYQATPYNLAPVESIRKVIDKGLDAVDRAPDLYEVSLDVEPRETEDVKLARVLRESGML